MSTLISTQKPITQLMGEFLSGNIAIPEIQRDVVWKADQVKLLIGSIFRQYPCGSLIFWEPREKDRALMKSMIRPERLLQFEGLLPRYFLLDGQQRLTALASVFLKREKLKELLAEVEEDLPYIYANLRRFPEELEATTDPSSYAFPWMSLYDVIVGKVDASDDLRHRVGKDLDRIHECIQLLRDYQFPVQIIQDRKYEDVAEIFARVNSMGTQLTGAEIHLAKIVPRWRGITKHIRIYRQDLRSRCYEVDLTFLLRAVTAVECDVAQITKLAERIAKDRLSKQHLDRSWLKARRSIDRVVTTLRDELSLDRSRYFTSKNVLIPLVYYAAKEQNKTLATRQILRFFLCSQLSERYGSGAERALRKDFRVLSDLRGTRRQNLEELADSVAADARQEYRGLKVKPSDVKGVPSKNILLLLLYIVMRERGATDWGSSSRKGIQNIEPKKMHLHHLFPFNFMMKDRDALDRARDEDLTPSEYRTMVNDIANITFISTSTNARVGDQAPFVYLPNETTYEIRRAHFIPEDRSLWNPDSFPEFLNARRKMIAQAINRLLKPLK